MVGQVVKYKIEKNKTYKRMQTGEMEFYFDKDNSAEISEGHYDVFKSIILEAISWGVIERSGAWFYLDAKKEQKFQGVESLVAHLRDNPTIVSTMFDKILFLSKAKKVDSYERES